MPQVLPSRLAASFQNEEGYAGFGVTLPGGLRYSRPHGCLGQVVFARHQDFEVRSTVGFKHFLDPLINAGGFVLGIGEDGALRHRR